MDQRHPLSSSGGSRIDEDISPTSQSTSGTSTVDVTSASSLSQHSDLSAPGGQAQELQLAAIHDQGAVKHEAIAEVASTAVTDHDYPWKPGV